MKQRIKGLPVVLITPLCISASEDFAGVEAAGISAAWLSNAPLLIALPALFAVSLMIIIGLIEFVRKLRRKNAELIKLGGNFHTDDELLDISPVDYMGKYAGVAGAVDTEDDGRKKAQMLMAQRSLQTLLDTLPLAIRIADVEAGGILYVNKAWLELFEYDSLNDVAKRPVTDFLVSVSGPVPGDLMATLRNEKPVTREVTYSKSTGEHFKTLLTSYVTGYNGTPVSIGIIRNLELERREAELREAAMLAQAASRAKSDFLANMSHEIRTPLNSIIGFTELALDSGAPLFISEYLLKIKDSSEVLLNIIDDILDISKIEAGKIELESIPFDVRDIFKSCQTIIMPKAMQKGISLYCYAEPSIGMRLLGDSTRLRQALLNLLSNAVKFTDKGVVKLLAVIEDSSEDAVTIRFEVKDSGIGMEPGQTERIFDPFVQADESTTRRYGGTGLGLSITKNIIELMGGEIKVESTPSEGSRFCFSLTFPVASGLAEGIDERAYIKKTDKPLFSGEILICEDNEMNQQVISEHLSKVGISSVLAANGKEAVDVVKRRMAEGGAPFDLIFMDMHMPEMDGLEAARQLAGLGCETPVVALTANVMAGNREVFQINGMSDYLGKPFTPQSLWQCLLRHLKPAGWEAADLDADDGGRHLRRLRANFVKDNQNTYDDIKEAIASGDAARACRIAHTLKGTAGLIGKARLQEAAQAVEGSLQAELRGCGGALVEALGRELNAVLEELAPLIYRDEPCVSIIQPLDAEKAGLLLDRLEEMLKSGDSDSLNFTQELRAIPGSEMLIEQIDRYDFVPAQKTLKEIRIKTGI